MIEEQDIVLGYVMQRHGKNVAHTVFSVEASVYTQGKSFGSKLYQALFVELRKLPIHSVLGGISLPNPASIALHKKSGMTQVARLPEIGR